MHARPILLLSMALFLLSPANARGQQVWALGDYGSLDSFAPCGAHLLSRSAGMTQTIGGHRAVSATPDGSCWFTEVPSGRFTKLTSTGKVVFIDNTVGAFTVDATSDGGAFTLDYASTIDGSFVRRRDKNGNVVQSAQYGGVDLVVDEIHSSVWVVGPNLLCLDLQLAPKGSGGTLPWTAVSVDADFDGSAWIVERQHPNIPESQDRLLHLAENGARLDSIGLPPLPVCVRVDRTARLVWIASWDAVAGGLFRYDINAHAIMHVSSDPAWGIDIDRETGTIWVGSRSGMLTPYSSDGAAMCDAVPVAGDQVYVAISSGTPTIVQTTSWGAVKARYR